MSLHQAYETALSSSFALMALHPVPGTPESRAVERIFGLAPIDAAKTEHFLAAMKVAAKEWANAQ